MPPASLGPTLPLPPSHPRKPARRQAMPWPPRPPSPARSIAHSPAPVHPISQREARAAPPLPPATCRRHRSRQPRPARHRVIQSRATCLAGRRYSSLPAWREWDRRGTVERAVVARGIAQLRETLCRARGTRQLVFSFGRDGGLPPLLRSGALRPGLRGCCGICHREKSGRRRKAGAEHRSSMPLEFFETALSHGRPPLPKPFAKVFPFLRRRLVLPELPDAAQLTQACADRFIFRIRHAMQRDCHFVAFRCIVALLHHELLDA